MTIKVVQMGIHRGDFIALLLLSGVEYLSKVIKCTPPGLKVTSPDDYLAINKLFMAL